MSDTRRNARPGNPLLAVAYLRVSTDEQKLGPEAQRAAIEAWARSAGVSVVAWHTDAGVSGGSDLSDRPALVAALGELRAVRAGVLVIAKRDRLARDVGVAATIERAVRASGAKVRTADGTGNGDTAADALLRTMLDAVAEHERALIKARTSAALRAKRARGERAGEVPYGYSATPEGKLETNAAEQKVIAVVHELRAAGMPFRALERELARRGLVARSGRPLGLKQIFRITKAQPCAA